MGIGEENSRKRRRNRNIQKAILFAVQLAGALADSFLNPSISKAIKFADERRAKRAVMRSRKRLVEAGLLKYNTKKLLELTPKGTAKLRQLNLVNYRLKRPEKWDGSWRMLTFDISEKRKMLRNKVRNTLIAIGFYKLQRSVWVYPYDCEDLITLLKADFKIGKDLLYVVADFIENDGKVRKFFGL